MSEESLIISVSGIAATELARRMFPPCPCPPTVRLSFALSDLPKGSIVAMSTGTVVKVSFPAPEAGAPLLKYLFHVTATDQTGNPVIPTGLSAVSDNPLIVPTLNTDDNVSFWFAVNTADAATGNTTIIDAGGNTLVVTTDQTVGGVPTVTLSGFADPPVAQ